MDYKEIFEKLGVKIPNILLPKAGTDLSKYAVLACDQYAAQPEYWEKVRAYVGGSPSTLHMTLPEAWLIAGDKDYSKRTETMEKYLSEEILEEIGDGFIFTERNTPDGTRYGLVATFDLEQYDYNPGSDKLIKVTEHTDITRVAPRVEIRKKAPLELPHVLMLIVDKQDKFFSMLKKECSALPKIYDFDLMEGGGNIKGKKIESEILFQKIADILYDLFEENGGTFSFAMGDGNHSFATAKCYWEELKKTLSAEEQKNHPARFCLAEIINLYDPAMPYECMNRLLTGVADPQNALDEMGLDLSALPSLQELQPVLDRWLEAHPEAKIEYVHDANTCERLGKEPGCIAFCYREFDRDSVYDMIKNNSVFVRKSFAMGHPYEKRYYLEGRKIR
ncbi:MAG: DUF1015 family protein [Oscillospiraceae bacterium]|nr:DUF1015 family protein [Oscillospiraceae bacterium]MBQ6701103.1 DUF1015 family protein [Oscillospiraceae bacterium]